MTNICFVSPCELDSKIIQFIKVIARVSDLPRLVAQPAHYLQQALKVDSLLRLGVRVIVPQIALPAIVGSVPKVDEDSLGVPDV